MTDNKTSDEIKPREVRTKIVAENLRFIRP